ncbi:MAG TPA: glutamate-5-semialdehyde dehydrogenase [Polyangiaceae bacterium]|nr:glutamate-5-semialdehyde dehydrogenase [Polyangiaceae bacterium]
MVDVPALCRRARAASRALGPRDRHAKDAALRGIARGIRDHAAEILAASAGDVEEARALGTSGALLDRLALDARRVEQMAQAVEQIAGLEDPVGAVLSDVTRPDGLRIRRVRVPIGVVAMIYEARPNVTAEASALCLKAGNAVVLRGGSEAARSNATIVAVVADALERAGLPRDAVQALPPGERAAIGVLVQQTDTVDLVIPRGGEALIRFVRENARVPVIAHAQGVCHLYVDRGADVEAAASLAVNGKLQRPGVCNALECLLVDAADAARLLPPVARALLDGGCELRGCEQTRALVPEAKPAADEDWGREYLDRILAVRVVDGLDGALRHVERYGSRHTEAICTRTAEHAERWRREVDAACVVVNASTRFHDGGELGLGAEIGIATGKLHWRGAMGLEALTTFQWVLDGAGQVRR